MNRLVVHFTQTHEANSCNINGDDRDSGKNAPVQVLEGRTMRQPLTYGHPSQKSKRDIRGALLRDLLIDRQSELYCPYVRCLIASRLMKRRFPR